MIPITIPYERLNILKIQAIRITTNCIKRVLLLVVFSWIFSNGYSQCTAIIGSNIDPLEGCDILTIQFNDLSSSVVSRTWDFGDGSPIVGAQNPVHSFTTNGRDTSYIVKLTITCASGTGTATKAVRVFAKPKVNYSASKTSICAITDSVCMVNTSDFAAGNSYLWNFGDATISDKFEPCKTYSTPGIYDITLTVINEEGCLKDSTMKQLVKVEQIPSTAFSVNAFSGCSPFNVIFINNTDTVGNDYSDWTWDFGDSGAPFLGFKPPVRTYSNIGEYTVTLGTKNAIGCYNYSTQKIVVKPTPIAKFNAALPACQNENLFIEFTGSTNSSPTFTWGFDDPIFLAGGGEGPYFVQWEEAGSKNVTLTVSETGCSSSFSQKVQINPITKVSLSISANLDTICSDQEATFGASPSNYENYSFFVNSTMVQNSAESQYTGSGFKNLDRIYAGVVDINGCTQIVSDTLVLNVIDAPTITISSSAVNDTICFGAPISFSALPSGYDEYTFYVANTVAQTGPGRIFNYSNLQNNERVYATAKNDICLSEASNNIFTGVKDILPAPAVYCGNSTVSTIQFSWDEIAGATSYEISLDNGAFQNPSTGSTGTFHFLSGLGINENHSIRVRAVDQTTCGNGMISAAVTCSSIDCGEILFNLKDQTRTVCENDNVILSIDDVNIPDYSIKWNNESNTSSNFYSITAQKDTIVPVLVINNAAPLCPPVKKYFIIRVSKSPDVTMVSSAGSDPVCAGTPIVFTAFSTDLKKYLFYENNKLVKDSPDNFYVAEDPIDARHVFVSGQNDGCKVSSPDIIMKVVQPLETPQVNYSFSTDNSVVFYWNPVQGASGYRVSVNNGIFVIPSSGSAGLNHAVTSLMPGQAVTISIYALGSTICGNSEISQPAIGFAENCSSFYYEIKNDFTICSGDSINLVVNNLNLSNYEVTWGALPPSKLKSIYVAPQKDTIISVVIKNLDKPYCPRQVSYITVKVKAKPNKVVLTSSDANNLICEGELVRFTANPAGFDAYYFYRGSNLIQEGYSNFYETSDWLNNQQISAYTVNEGCEGELSDKIITSVKSRLSIPQVNPGVSNTGSISFVWDSIPKAVGYKVSIDGGAYVNPSTGLTGLSHVINGFTADDSVKITVIALGDLPCGNSEPSLEVTGYAIVCEGISYKLSPTQSICENEEITLSISNITPPNHSISWDKLTFGSDTTLKLTGYNDTIVTVKVKNNLKPECPVSTKYFEIDVTNIPQIVLVSSSSNDTICFGEEVEFHVTPQEFDSYIFYNGVAVIQDSVITTYTPENFSNGNDISVEGFINTCSSKSNNISTTIIPLKNISLSASKTGDVCQNEIIQLTASPGFDRYVFRDESSTLLSSKIPVVSLNLNSSIITVSGFDVYNCESKASDTLHYNTLPLPSVIINCSVDSVCYSDFATYFAEPADLPSYLFYNNDSILFQSGITNVYATDSLKIGSIISVVGVDNNGCMSQPSESLFPYIFPYPDSRIQAAADGVCLNDSVSLRAIKDNSFFGVTYYWSTAQTTDSIRVSPPYPTTYSLYYNYQRCKNKVIDTKEIDVDRESPPIADAGDDVTICVNDSIQLNGSGGLTYLWNNGSTLNDSSLYDPMAKPITSTVYILRVTNKYCYTIDSVIVTLDRCLDDLTDPVPQIITPNGDGINDFWVVENVDYFENNRVDIYNRWGNLVFNTSPYNNTWDGKNNKGVDLPDGTYFYILDIGNGVATRTGFIIIHR